MDSTVTGADFSDSLINNLRFAGAAVIGAQLSQEIGSAFRTESIDRSAQLIAHAATGCLAGAVGTGNCGAGAAGQLAGEVSAILYGNVTADGVSELTQEWTNRGVDVARIAGALASFAAGGDADDVNLGSDAGGTAAANNELLTITLTSLAILSASYGGTLAAGQLITGEEILGNDPLSQALASGAKGAVRLSSENFPEMTQAALNTLKAAGEIGNVAVTFVDDKTGNVVSTTFNNLSPENQHRVLAGAVLATIVIPNSGVTRIAKIRKDGSINTANLSNIQKAYFGQERKFWSSDPIEFNGNKVYQRADLFDPNFKSTWIRNGQEITGTNIQRMGDGNAPVGIDGNSIELHHMLQTQDGPIAEVTKTFHSNNYKPLHINSGSGIPTGINRNTFNTWKKQYWKKRSEELN